MSPTFDPLHGRAVPGSGLVAAFMCALTRLANPTQPHHHSNMHANVFAPRLAPALASDELCNVPCFNGELVARLRGGLPNEVDLEQARNGFAALADGSRLKIVHMLGRGDELCVCDIAHVLGVSVSAASHHLRRLRDLEILTSRSDGKMVYYRLRDETASGLVALALTRVSSAVSARDEVAGDSSGD